MNDPLPSYSRTALRHAVSLLQDLINVSSSVHIAHIAHINNTTITNILVHEILRNLKEILFMIDVIPGQGEPTINSKDRLNFSFSEVCIVTFQRFYSLSSRSSMAKDWNRRLLWCSYSNLGWACGFAVGWLCGNVVSDWLVMWLCYTWMGMWLCSCAVVW